MNGIISPQESKVEGMTAHGMIHNKCEFTAKASFATHGLQNPTDWVFIRGILRSVGEWVLYYSQY